MGITRTTWHERYGDPRTRGSSVEMANACLNNQYQGRGSGISFTTYQKRTGRGNAARGWWGRPRLPQRCMVGVTGVCTCQPADDALDGARVAA